LNRSVGYTKCTRRLVVCQTRKETAFDDARQPFIQFAEPRERAVHRQDMIGLIIDPGRVVIQCNALPITPAFYCAALTSHVDQQIPHHDAVDREKVISVFPFEFRPIDESQIRFVDQRGRIECDSRTLTLHVPARDDAQILARQMVKPVRMPSGNEIPSWGMPLKVNEAVSQKTLSVPGFNQHRDEILKEIGLSNKKDA